MPHPSKKQRRECHHERDEGAAEAVDDFLASFDDLSIDVLPNILAFLSLKDIMSKRRLNKKWREAVRRTIVPPTEFNVDSVRDYNVMTVMTRALPNLQQIAIGGLGGANKYNDGEDPDEDLLADTADYTTYDIELISNFRELSILAIKNSALLNGRYPVLFNSFPLLQRLSLDCSFLKWDLDTLAALPVLKELECESNYDLTGNINSLRVLKDTLEKVTINNCRIVEGNFMDLADFQHLKRLDLDDTAVTGDIRDIGAHDFVGLEEGELHLPEGVYGGRCCEFQRISDAPDLVRAVYLFIKQRPELEYYWYGKLSGDSPDWYESAENDDDDDETPPFYIVFVEAGSRLGYRWENNNGYHPCEVNWLDPEPDRESSDYEKYIEELEQINRHVHMFRGFHQPPTEEEYIRLSEDYV